MEWNTVVPATLDVQTDAASLESADLILVGVVHPAKDDKEDDDNKSEDEDTKDETPIVLTGTAQSLDSELDGALSEWATESKKSLAKAGGTTSTVLRLKRSNTQFQKYMLVSCGTTGKTEDRLGSLLGKALAEKSNAKKIERVTFVLPSEITINDTFWHDLSAAFYEHLYSDSRFKGNSGSNSNDKKKKKQVAEDLQSVTIYTTSSTDTSTHDIAKGRSLAQGVIMTKDIVNAPHNILNSESLAETAQRIADSSNGRLTCTILGKQECEDRGMGAYLGVARGSETEPKFIHLTYTPPDSSGALKKVAVVGKGLLFDTGGYNIKTQMMEMMKFDCGGAAAVLGAARAVAELQPAGVEAHFIVAACENMINEKAVVPSDILTASNGKTIEVLNTDAEGRLTLADALVYADKEIGAESIIELSTLTGACMVSLGKGMCGLWTKDDALAAELADISKLTGDKSWRMPLPDEYKEMLESKFADMKNIGGKYGGAITAALFLHHFVNPKKPFAHLDIAGPVWSEKSGATGFGCKLVVEWIRRQGVSKVE
jgi:leucyl aminopeptidase